MTTPRPFAAKATLRLAALMALAVTILSLAAMVLQYRLVETRLMQAQQSLLTADLNGNVVAVAEVNDPFPRLNYNT